MLTFDVVVIDAAAAGVILLPEQTCAVNRAASQIGVGLCERGHLVERLFP